MNKPKMEIVTNLEGEDNIVWIDFKGKEIKYGKKNFKNPSLILKNKNI